MDKGGAKHLCPCCALQGSLEDWCIHCQCLDHATNSFPLWPCKHIWSSAFCQLHQGNADKPVCIKYKKFNDDCKFGKECRFRHVCSSCGDPHPASKNARLKAAASPSRGRVAWWSQLKFFPFFFCFSVIATCDLLANCQVIEVWFGGHAILLSVIP